MLSDFGGLFDLSGKRAIVTGGAQGLGKAVCEGFCAHNAAVCVVDINLDAARGTADEIKKQGGAAFALRCDVSNEEDVAAMVRAAAEKMGGVDTLVANAGVGDRAPAYEMTAAQWDRVIAIDLKGVWLCNQQTGRYMIDHGIKGSIVNMASVTGIVGILTGNANYAAAKGGVSALTRTLAVEWAGHGIRVNAIAPAQVSTELVEKLMEQKPQTRDYFLSRIPLGRLGSPLDIAAAAVYLASPAAAWVTGQTLAVDGGNTIAY